MCWMCTLTEDNVKYSALDTEQSTVHWTLCRVQCTYTFPHFMKTTLQKTRSKEKPRRDTQYY
jgi:hypothetical protein